MSGETIELELPIYSFHIDSNQSVSNIVFIQWMEIARLKLMETAGFPIQDIGAMGFAGIITETCVKYVKPLILGDKVSIQLWISRLRYTSATLNFRFTQVDGETVAEGRQEALFVSLKSGKPHRPTSAQRAAFERFHISNTIDSTSAL